MRRQQNTRRAQADPQQSRHKRDTRRQRRPEGRKQHEQRRCHADSLRGRLDHQRIPETRTTGLHLQALFAPGVHRRCDRGALLIGHVRRRRNIQRKRGIGNAPIWTDQRNIIGIFTCGFLRKPGRHRLLKHLVTQLPVERQGVAETLPINNARHRRIQLLHHRFHRTGVRLLTQRVTLRSREHNGNPRSLQRIRLVRKVLH